MMNTKMAGIIFMLAFMLADVVTGLVGAIKNKSCGFRKMREGLWHKLGNIREAGAHCFADKKGEVWKSVPMNRTAWSVGGKYSLENGAGKYYGKCTNYNSVSVELCDCTETYSAKQAKAVKNLVK